MRIGYSFWGFLTDGITDTPDGGRSHRRTLIDGLRAAGHELVFLQSNRDLYEAGTDLREQYEWDSTGLPEIDALFLEWRWPIAGRNTTPCGSTGHTCDLHRQQQLLTHYTEQGLPTILWDKDQHLPDDDPLRTHPAVTVCEPALYPRLAAHSLLFPIADTLLDQASPAELAGGFRSWPLVYIGNQYDRDDAFTTFFAPAARSLPHQVAGKWPRAHPWPHVHFSGRIPFGGVHRLYQDATATVLLLPDRYAARGQMTQRLFEAALAGCLPLAPTTIRGIDHYVPTELHVRSGHEVTHRVTALRRASHALRTDLLAGCLRRLELFRLTHQLAALTELLPAVSGPVETVHPEAPHGDEGGISCAPS